MCCENVRLRTVEDLEAYFFRTLDLGGNKQCTPHAPIADAGHIQRAKRILGLEWPVILCRTPGMTHTAAYAGGPNWSSWVTLPPGMEKRTDIHYISVPDYYCRVCAELAFWHELGHARQMENLTPVGLNARRVEELSQLSILYGPFEYMRMPLEREANEIAARYHHYTRIFR